jgi:hypothetical protein
MFVRIQYFSLTGSAINPGPGYVDVRAHDLEPGTHSIDEHTRRNILPHFTARLDGRSRFELTQPQQLTNLRTPPGNYLSHLARNRDDRLEVRRKTEQAFHLYFALDSTAPGSLSPVLAQVPPSHDEDAPWSEEAIAFQSAAQQLSLFSDGVQVYTALVAAAQSTPHRVLLLDEPEAFLHPTLARRLGRELASLAVRRRSSLVAATHSAEFLYGAVTEAADTTIVRLTYRDGVATARALEGDQVRRLVANPLLRSANTLSALFASSAVVCEADADRAFYEEVNRRLFESGRAHVEDGVFLNAQNWQTIPKIAGPLRSLGIPAAVVIDLDALTRDETWPELFAMLGHDIGLRDELAIQRKSVGRVLLDAGRLGSGEDSILACKAQGLSCLAEPQRGEIDRFLALLRDYGIFVVPVGELEKWLRNLGVTNKQTWVSEILSRMGDAYSPGRIVPSAGDVWEFVEGIGAWTESTTRKGIP